MSGLIIKRQLVYANQLVLLRLVNYEFSFSRAVFLPEVVSFTFNRALSR